MYLQEANIIKTVLVLYQFVRFSEQDIRTALCFSERLAAWRINEEG